MAKAFFVNALWPAAGLELNIEFLFLCTSFN